MAVAAPETTSFWGVEGGKSVVLVVAAPSGEAPSAESSKEAPRRRRKRRLGRSRRRRKRRPSRRRRKNRRFGRRADADPLGGSAADGAKGEKTPVLTVAASGATSFGGAASNETAVAASEACCFGGAETSEATPNEASSEEKPPLSVAVPTPTLWAEARQTAPKVRKRRF